VTQLDRILAGAAFFLTAVVLFMAPWFFGAWEHWWFWPFAGGIFLAAFCFGVRLLLRATAQGQADLPPIPSLWPGSVAEWGTCSGVLAALLPFLVYAAVRGAMTDVFMDAERSVLLFLTPVLAGLLIAFNLTSRRRRVLFILLACNLVLLGLYGVVNHVLYGSRHVLWVQGYDSYVSDNRATGSYFCPDHFAGIMELALGAALGLILDRRRGVWTTLAGVGVAALAAAAVLLSKSRGGGLTVLVILGAASVWGFAQLERRQRWVRRAILLGLAGAIAVGVWFSGSGYVERFKHYFRPSWGESEMTLLERMQRRTRVRMIGGAMRAWRSNPVWGIGPGMHQNLWPHFAATEDGDREKGLWPSQTNHDYHSYEVHSDWVQFLEEYGIVGFMLFLVPLTLAGCIYQRGFARARRRWVEFRRGERNGPDFGVMLAGFLALVAMVFHSLGDFNLQMPATTWMLAALVTLGLCEAERSS
jgi:O-antigen ligase